jgi:membrane-bound lytic murein transglycosylase D
MKKSLLSSSILTFLFGSLATVSYAAPATAEFWDPITMEVQHQNYQPNGDVEDEIQMRLRNISGQVDLTYNQLVVNHIIGYVFRRREAAQMIMGRGKMYMPIFERYLAQYNMPNELKNLAVIESALNPFAVSPAGAGGLWQFMPGTAPMWGLKIDKNVDERFDPEKSTEAACKFLSYLYGRYGNWHLAIAAYNCGPGRVDNAILQAGGISDFWTIYDFLPAETRNYVPAFIAATYLNNYYSVYGIEPASLDSKLSNTESTYLERPMTFREICQATGVSPAVITYLNPSFRRGVVPANPGNTYRITLPTENYVALRNYIDTNQMPVLQNAQEGVAMNIAPPVESAPRWENVAESVPVNASPRMVERAERAAKKAEERAEKTAKPAKVEKAEKNEKASKKDVHHKIKRGDTLSELANQYGVDIDDLRRWNGVKKGARGNFMPGDVIIVKKK